MGMFDEVNCQQPLPGPIQPARPDQMQSKDLGRELDQYTITADGLLVGPNGPEDFHGWLWFGTYETEGSGMGGMSFRYKAKFTDGKLQHIVCTSIQKIGHGFCENIYPEPES